VRDVTGAGDRWIPDDEYNAITNRVPIVCVDLLPLAPDRSSAIGLILRETYDGNRGWCLVGGAVLLNESLADAVGRHVSSTLGTDMSLRGSTLEFVDVIEYFSEPNRGDFYDPRKHSVGLSYVAEVEGSPVAQGEALEFQWFPAGRLPSPDSFGFGQERVVQRLLRHVDPGQF
jgi:ADP-ribose pyrophosphatase YjhB (NUDIX family)